MLTVGHSVRLFVATLATTVAGLTGSVEGQVWDGGGANDAWTTANNWSPNVVPVNDGTANVAFGAGRPTPIVNVSQNVRAVTFVNRSGAFVITSGGFRTSLTIGAGGITNADNSLQSITCPVTLGAAQTWRANNGPLSVGFVLGDNFPLTINGSFDTSIVRITSSGAALIKNGSGTLTMTGASSYSGATSVNAGALQASNSSGSATGTGAVSVASGATLRGAGIIGGPVQNDGTVRPGAPGGALMLEDTYTQGSSGVLAIEIGGPASTDFGRLSVTGTATLSGTLTVTLINGYTPVRGDSFEVVTAGAISGEFAAVNLPALTGTKIWQAEYSTTAVRLTVSDSAVITYQGRLRNGAQLASGPHDFQFRLFDAPTGGAQIASTQCADNVAVAEGLFTATFDFGNQYATPAPRFLEVWGRADTGLGCSDPSGFALVGGMGGRQRLLSNPLAAHSGSAFALDAPDGSHPSALFVDNAGNVGIGTTSPRATVHVVTTGEGVRVQGPAVGAPNGAWIGFRDSTGAEIGNVGDASGGDSSIYLTSDTGDVHLYTAAGPALTARVGGRVGIGTTAPTNKLDVRGDVALGSAGQFRAAAADFNLRIIRGVIHYDPNSGQISIGAGSGFTLSSPGPGHYTITFSTPFSAQPSVTATAQGLGDDFFSLCFAMTQSVTPTGVNLEVANRSDGQIVNRTTHFIVIGLR